MSYFKNKVQQQSKLFSQKIKMEKMYAPSKSLTEEEFSYSREDASRYAEKYYGDIYRQTTRYDNDWD